MKLKFLLVTMLLVSSFAHADGGSDVGNSGGTASALTLLGLTYDRHGVHVQVETGGCTDKESVAAKLTEGEPKKIEFVRTKGDPCRMFSIYGVILDYSFEELGLQPGDEFEVANKIQPNIRGTLF